MASEEKVKQIEEKIYEHTREVVGRPLEPRDPTCPYCEMKDITFYLHERRARQFFVVFNIVVKVIMSFLIRWKCSNCERTWTEYPSFCGRYRRYVNESVIDVALEYVLDEKADQGESSTYKQVARGESTSRGYVDEMCGIIENRLGASSVWRFVGLVGGKVGYLESLLTRIKENEPANGIFRRIAQVYVAACKYRSDARRLLLETAKKIRLTLCEHRKIFGNDFYPDFEI